MYTLLGEAADGVAAGLDGGGAEALPRRRDECPLVLGLTPEAGRDEGPVGVAPALSDRLLLEDLPLEGERLESRCLRTDWA